MKNKGILVILFITLLTLIMSSCDGTKLVLVTAITVTGEDDQETVTLDETLRMEVQIQPMNASNKAVTWSVENATGSSERGNRAKITQEGLLTGLSAGTVVVKATAKDKSEVEGTKEITVTEPRPQIYSLTIIASPAEGGIVSQDGDYLSGENVNITATPNENYRFVNWTSDGSVIGTTATFQYKMPTEDTTLVANFIEKAQQEARYLWKTLLLVYPSINVQFSDPQSGSIQHYAYQMTPEELLIGLQDYNRFPSLAYNLSDEECYIHSEIIIVDRPISSVTPYVDETYWVSPDDIRLELDTYAPMGSYDSILVMVPPLNKPNAGTTIPTGWWGLGYWPGNYANGATFGIGQNYTQFIDTPKKDSGELWLHEWLHGSCSFYANEGFLMPEGNADGAESHGYTHDSVWGWSIYYQDLMTGKVWDESQEKWTGITPEAWKSGSITNQTCGISAEYFRENTLQDFRQEGISSWNYNEENVILGDESQETSSSIYMVAPQGNDLKLTGRVEIPTTAGRWDSISLSLKGTIDEYWGMLMYGTELNEKDHIGISKNDVCLENVSLDLIPGWYTIKLMVDSQNQKLWLKVWADGSNEPEKWQVTTILPKGWDPLEIGFRYFGSESCVVDDLIYVKMD